jgi:hypothetical protein
MNLGTAAAALACAACTTLTAGALVAGPAVASTRIAPRDGTTLTVLSLSAAQVAFGQEDSEVLTVSVNAAAGGGLPPTGLVRVLEGTTEVCRFTFASFGGHCSPSGSQLAPGPHSLTAVYNGDGRNNPSASIPLLLTVAKQQPTAFLSLSSRTASVGTESAVDLAVDVGVAGVTAPTGTVSVSEDGSLLCMANLAVGGGTVICHMGDAALADGEHRLVASYSGDGNYDSAQSAGQDLRVTQDETSLAMTLPASSLSVSQEDGAQISFSITPAVPVSGVPISGRIGIGADTANADIQICTPEITQFTGTCTMAAGQLPPGTYHVSAFYMGDSHFGSSSSDTQTLTITADPPAAVQTSTKLALSAVKATFGHEQAERLSVQVEPQSGSRTPAGQVTVKAGTASVCTITLSGGTGSCALGATKLRPGSYQLTASYGGGTGFHASASGQKALTVAAEPTTTSLTLSKRKVKFGHEQAEHLSVQVKPQFGGTPTGKVTIRAGSVKVCVITLKGGKGSCTLKARQLRAGAYHLAASYAAESPSAGSTSASKPLTVTK